MFSNHSTFHRGSAQSSAFLLLSSDELMSCAAGTNGCLDLRCRAFLKAFLVDEHNPLAKRCIRNALKTCEEQEILFEE